MTSLDIGPAYQLSECNSEVGGGECSPRAGTPLSTTTTASVDAAELNGLAVSFAPTLLRSESSEIDTRQLFQLLHNMKSSYEERINELEAVTKAQAAEITQLRTLLGKKQ